MKYLKITPDWILNNMTNTITASENMTTVYCDLNESKWVELLLSQFEIKYSEEEFEEKFINEVNQTRYSFSFSYSFSIEAVRYIAPSFFACVSDLNAKNSGMINKS